MARPNYLSHHCCLPQCTPEGSCSQKGSQVRNTGTLIWDKGVLTGSQMPTSITTLQMLGSRAITVAQEVKLPPMAPASHTGASVSPSYLTSVQLSAKAWKSHGRMPKSLGPCTQWETWRKLQAPGFKSAIFPALGHGKTKSVTLTYYDSLCLTPASFCRHCKMSHQYGREPLMGQA